MHTTLIAMAAGMGSRFGGLKQVSKFGDSQKTILDFAIEDALSAGIDKLVFVIRKDIEELFRENVSRKYENSVDVRYVFQELNGAKLPEGRTKPWGTGHAVLACADNVSEPFMAINSDDYYGRGVYSQAVEFLSQKNSATHAMAGYKLKNTLSKNGGVSRGICQANPNTQELIGIREYSDLKAIEENPLKISSKEGIFFTGEEFTSLNFWSFAPDFMNQLGEYYEAFLSINSKDMKAEFYLPAAVDQSIKESKAKAIILPTDEIWQGVTYKEDSASVEQFLKDTGRI